jgi:hypothetical protein
VNEFKEKSGILADQRAALEEYERLFAPGCSEGPKHLRHYGALGLRRAMRSPKGEVWLAEPKLAWAGSPPSPMASARQPSRPSSLSLRSSFAGHASPLSLAGGAMRSPKGRSAACRAEARVDRKPAFAYGFGAAAFSCFAIEGWWAHKGSERAARSLFYCGHSAPLSTQA